MLPSSDTCPRRTITRRRTGCLTCRLRRKRCDEDKPICLGCVRNSLVCRWPSHEARESFGDTASWRQTLQGLAEERQCNSEVQDSRRGLCAWTHGIPTSASTKQPSTFPLGRLPYGLSSKPMILRTEMGSHLFQHFLELVGLQLSSRNDPENPWITLFVPLAMKDELVMSTLLALAGANLCTYSGHALMQTYSYYAVAVRSVKHRVTALAQGNFSNILNTLVTTIALSQFEAMIGDTRGVLLYHLQACRELLQLSQRKSLRLDPTILAFVLESYLYTSALGTTFVYDDRQTSFAFDSEYDLLNSLFDDSRGYGFMLGYASKLLQLLPQLVQTVGRWIHPGSDLEPSRIDQEFFFFEAELTSWEPSYGPDADATNLACTLDDKPERQSILRSWHHDAQVVANIYRQALLALLYTGGHGRRPPDEALLALTDHLIDEFFRLRGTLSPESPVWALMLWPTVMIGSCIRRLEDQLLILDKDCAMMPVINAFNVLQQIWNDEREIVFGIVGLSMICRGQKITLCAI